MVLLCKLEESVVTQWRNDEVEPTFKLELKYTKEKDFWDTLYI